MSPVLQRQPPPVPAAAWGPRLAERVVREVTALAGTELRPAVREQLVALTLHGYDTYLAMLGGDDAAGGPERMAELTGHVFEDMRISLEDAISLQRHLEQVLRQEVRRAAERHLQPDQLAHAEVVAHRFFNDLSVALADGWLAARRQHDSGRTEAEAALLLCLLALPPRLGEARQIARELRIDLAAAWEVAVLVAESDELDRAVSCLRQALWGAVILTARTDLGLVVAVQRRGAAATWPDLGSGVVCGIGEVHEHPHGLRHSHEQACEAVDLARRRGVPLVRFADAWLDRFLLGAATATELAQQVLAPLADLTPNRRATVLETLEAYLDCGGSVTAMADALHMHRQSVNYRVSNLRRALGPALATAEGRLALHVAVKALKLGPP